MPKFKNTVSGVVVSVDAEAAMRLPGSWEPFDEAQKAAPRRRTPRKKAEPKSPPTIPDDLTEKVEDVTDDAGESDDLDE